MIAMQGPKVIELISAFSREIPQLKRYRFVEKNMLIAKIMISRTGYTGDLGYEVVNDIETLPKRLTAIYRKLTT
jgi:aminomethyltransferase